ncbi:MAG: hypothetical protein K6F93_07400 [Lachnospiraceae bacterium]|nr:hypothetical protein [Lachnospiraceae bacterium]
MDYVRDTAYNGYELINIEGPEDVVKVIYEEGLDFVALYMENAGTVTVKAYTVSTDEAPVTFEIVVVDSEENWEALGKMYTEKGASCLQGAFLCLQFVNLLSNTITC